MINSHALGRMVKRKRSADRISLRDLEVITGITASTLSRVENGAGDKLQVENFLQLTHWLNCDPREFIPSIAASTPEIRIEALLRQSKIADEDIGAIMRLITTLLRRAK